MDTWNLVRLPPGKTPINKWVYKEKTNSDGSVKRYKCFVDCGLTQESGIEVATMTTMWMIIALANVDPTVSIR